MKFIKYFCYINLDICIYFMLLVFIYINKLVLYVLEENRYKKNEILKLIEIVIEVI